MRFYYFAIVSFAIVAICQSATDDHDGRFDALNAMNSYLNDADLVGHKGKDKRKGKGKYTRQEYAELPHSQRKNSKKLAHKKVESLTRHTPKSKVEKKLKDVERLRQRDKRHSVIEEVSYSSVYSSGEQYFSSSEEQEVSQHCDFELAEKRHMYTLRYQEKIEVMENYLSEDNGSIFSRKKIQDIIKDFTNDARLRIIQINEMDMEQLENVPEHINISDVYWVLIVAYERALYEVLEDEQSDALVDALVSVADQAEHEVYVSLRALSQDGQADVFHDVILPWIIQYADVIGFKATLDVLLDEYNEKEMRSIIIGEFMDKYIKFEVDMLHNVFSTCVAAIREDEEHEKMYNDWRLKQEQKFEDEYHQSEDEDFQDEPEDEDFQDEPEDEDFRDEPANEEEENNQDTNNSEQSELDYSEASQNSEENDLAKRLLN